MAFNFLFLKAYDLFSHTKKAKWTRPFWATFKVPHPIGDMLGNATQVDGGIMTLLYRFKQKPINPFSNLL